METFNGNNKVIFRIEYVTTTSASVSVNWTHIPFHQQVEVIDTVGEHNHASLFKGELFICVLS